MYLTTVVLGCFLLGQDPLAAASPPDVIAAPSAELQPIAQPELSGATEIPGSGVLVPESLSEAADPDEPGQTATKTAEVPTVPLPVEPARRPLTPPERVDAALTLAPQSRLSGRRVTIGSALSAVVDRRRQLEVCHAYWRLAEAVADYHFALEHENQLQHLQAAADDAAAWRAALASSSAQLQEAELSAVAAQHELAALMRLPSTSPLPLPADRPHVGPYRTHFKELFSMRPCRPGQG